MPLLKRSDIGEQGNDKPFEQGFANVAHAYLRDIAPGLLDYEVGFQLVDRDEDKKAVGVFGFKVGKQWLYAPVFFINGELKGHELLYIKDEDAFRPLKENWVNYLLAKRPQVLGKGVSRQTRHLGVRYPDMLRMTQSPHKYASVSHQEQARLKADAAAVREKVAGTALAPHFERMHDWAAIGVAAMSKHALAEGKAQRPLQLLEVIKSGGVPMVEALEAHFRAYPRLKIGFDNFYPAEQVKTAFAAVKASLQPRDVLEKDACGASCGKVKALLNHRRAERAKKAHSLEVYRLGDRLPVGMSQEDKTALLLQGVLIKDAREDDEVSKAYAVDVRIEAQKRLTNPTETGIYEVLTKPGDYERCLVLFGQTAPSNGTKNCTVIRLDEGSRAFLNIHPTRVWVRQDAGDQAADSGGGFEAYAKFFDSLPDADSFDTGDHATYVLLGARGQSTLPFVVNRSNVAGKGNYDVRFDSYSRFDEPALGSPREPSRWERCDTACDYRDQRVHLGMREGSRFRVVGGDVYVPKGAKKLKVKAAFSWDDELDGKARPSPIEPAGIEDVELGLLKRADLKRLTLSDAGGEVYINGTPRPRAEARISLIAGHGLREDVADQLLKEAADAKTRRGSAHTCLIKYADPYGNYYGGSPYLTNDGPSAPGIPDPDYGSAALLGSDASAQMYQERSLPVTDMQSTYNNRDAYYPLDATPDEQAVGVAEQAADRGQKEIFDTAVIGSLLKGTRDDMLVDRHLQPMLDALDHIGRLLFVFYWHGEQFAERYGESDMPELEDSLRNTFESLGDLVLFLRQKTVESTPDEAAQDIDLEAIAAQ